MYCWPQAISKNGSAELSRPSTNRGPARPRSSRSAGRTPSANGGDTERDGGDGDAPEMSVAGSRSRRPISISMNEAPQIGSSTSSVTR